VAERRDQSFGDEINPAPKAVADLVGHFHGRAASELPPAGSPQPYTVK
jgi:hypothetical protein